MDFAEQLESVAYVLCGEGTIKFGKFRNIWQVKGVSMIYKSYLYIFLKVARKFLKIKKISKEVI